MRKGSASKVITALLLTGLLTSMPTANAAPAKAAPRTSEQPKLIDYGIAAPISFARGIVACTLKDKTNLLLVLLMDSRGGYEMLTITPKNGKTQEIPLPFDPRGDSPFASVLSSRNKYYTHFGSHFVEYDPEEGKFTACHKTHYQMAMMMTEAPDGTIYSATYPNSGLVSYNPSTKKFIDYGSLNKENWKQYPRSLEVGADGWVYLGIGNTHGQVVAFSPATRQAIPLYTDAERPNPSDGRIMRTKDGRVFGRNTKSEQWYEFKNGKRIALNAPLNADNSIIKGAQTLFHKKFADGSQADTLSLEDRELKMRNSDGTAYTVKFDYKSEGGGAMSIAALEDGCLYGGTWFPMRFFKLDPKTGKLENKDAVNQFNTVYGRGKYLYIGAYSGGFVMRYDCTKPFDRIPTDKGPTLTNNPAYYGKFSTDCNRPHVIDVTPDGKTILMGGTPGYGRTGGGLVTVDAESGKTNLLTHQALAENESVHSMLILNNEQALLGTTTMAGTGGEVKAKQASLVLFDIKNQKKIFQSKPLAGQSITGLIQLDDGTVLGICDYRKLFVFDVKSQKCLRQAEIPQKLGSCCSDQGPRLFFHYQGKLLLALHKGLAIVDPAIPAVTALAEVPGGIGNGGAIVDDRFFFVAGSHVKSLDLRDPAIFKPIEPKP